MTATYISISGGMTIRKQEDELIANAAQLGIECSSDLAFSYNRNR